jgi:2-polyprenyl-6-methoxyphenol hydroxylase-like FAD-dependent oxidoreductase
MSRELEADRDESVVYYRKHNGELILGPTSFEDGESGSSAERDGQPHVGPAHIFRKKFYQMLLRQVAKLGIKIEYGQRVERYFENEEAGVGGVVTQNGTIRVAHIVVAADAFRTRSDLLIAGEHMPTRSSGMSVYRTALRTELALRDEAFKKRWGDIPSKKASHHEFWIAPGMHLGLFISPEFVAYGLTPRDRFLQQGGNEPVETWEPDVDPEEVVKVLRRIPNWDPAIEGLIRNTPKGAIVHWPLLWRNLRREWTSKGGRVVQVGDAAHSTVPTSISGATLAVEDAATLAACLQLAASSGVSGGPLGARVYNLLRYQRVSCVQKMSFVNSEALGDSNIDELKNNPEKVRVRFPKWLFKHEPETYAYEKYGQAFAHLVLGARFQNTNYPPGYKWRPWTIEEIHADVLDGKRIADFLDGDWS